MFVKKNPKAAPRLQKVFIVEDHPVFRQGLAQLVNDEKDLMVCGQAEDAEEALKAIDRLKPDIVLVDLSLSGRSGLELITDVRAKNRKIKLLVISMHDEALYAQRVMRAGGDGYIMKQEAPEEIIHALRDVLGGHLYVSDAVLAHAEQESTLPKSARLRPLDRLTDSELEILELIGKGEDVKQIAGKLKLSAKAVSAHRAQIKKKLKLKSVPALIRYAVCWVETGAA